MKNSNLALISFDECRRFLKIVYGAEQNITITNVINVSKGKRGFGFLIDNYEGDNAFATGYISFKEKFCDISLIKSSNEVVSTKYDDLYRDFIQQLIAEAEEKRSKDLSL